MDVEIPNFPPLFEFDEKLNVVKNTILENKNIQWIFLSRASENAKARLIQVFLSRAWKRQSDNLIWIDIP